jgi:Phage integrase family
VLRKSDTELFIGSPRNWDCVPVKPPGCVSTTSISKPVRLTRGKAAGGANSKNQKRRMLPGRSHLTNLVEHLRRSIMKWRPNTRGLFFASRNGTPFDQNLLVKRKLHPLLEKLNIRCGLHAFRHFSASMIDRLNTPLKLRQQRPGHSDAEMTLGVYSHVARKDDVRIAAQLGEILDPSGPFQKNKGAAGSQQPLVNESANWLRGSDLN